MHNATYALCNGSMQQVHYVTLTRALCNICIMQHMYYAICILCKLHIMQYVYHATCILCNATRYNCQIKVDVELMKLRKAILVTLEKNCFSIEYQNTMEIEYF